MSQKKGNILTRVSSSSKTTIQKFLEHEPDKAVRIFTPLGEEASHTCRSPYLHPLNRNNPSHSPHSLHHRPHRIDIQMDHLHVYRQWRAVTLYQSVSAGRYKHHRSAGTAQWHPRFQDFCRGESLMQAVMILQLCFAVKCR